MNLLRTLSRNLLRYRRVKPKIYEGDLVAVIRGSDKGKQGKVLETLRKYDMVRVEGINAAEKLDLEDEVYGMYEERPKKIEYKPVYACRVGLIDPSSGRPCRVSIGYLEDGTTVRISKQTGTIIPVPDLEEKRRAENKDKIDGPLDTLPSLAHEVTYQGEDFAKMRAEFEQRMREKEELERLLVFTE